VYPFISSLYYSLTQWDGISHPTYIGFANYLRLFDETHFKTVLLNTLLYTMASILLVNPISMVLALLLNSKIKGRGLLRTIFYLPIVLSNIVVSYVWVIILTYDGILNKVLTVLGMESYVIDWLGSVQKTKWVLIVILVWQGMGIGVVFYLAGLQAIPAELYESAYLDGVKQWSKFRHITFPLLMPTITVVTFFGMAGTLKLFDLPFIMTNGGPGVSTSTLAITIYKQAFLNSTYGYATATGIIMFLLIVSISIIQLKITRSREVEL